MQIIYRSKKLEKACTRRDYAAKHFGEEMAEKLQMRIAEIEAADTVEMMARCRIGRCHMLQGDRQGQYAVDLAHPYRLVFEQVDDKEQTVKVVEIVDYH